MGFLGGYGLSADPARMPRMKAILRGSLDAGSGWKHKSRVLWCKKLEEVLTPSLRPSGRKGMGWYGILTFLPCQDMGYRLYIAYYQR